jgi:hypothetical protein
MVRGKGGVKRTMCPVLTHLGLNPGYGRYVESLGDPVTGIRGLVGLLRSLADPADSERTEGVDE